MVVVPWPSSQLVSMVSANRRPGQEPWTQGPGVRPWPKRAEPGPGTYGLGKQPGPPKNLQNQPIPRRRNKTIEKLKNQTKQLVGKIGNWPLPFFKKKGFVLFLWFVSCSVCSYRPGYGWLNWFCWFSPRWGPRNLSISCNHSAI